MIKFFDESLIFQKNQDGVILQQIELVSGDVGCKFYLPVVSCMTLETLFGYWG
jgi:hypothetical protein